MGQYTGANVHYLTTDIQLETEVSLYSRTEEFLADIANNFVHTIYQRSFAYDSPSEFIRIRETVLLCTKGSLKEKIAERLRYELDDSAFKNKTSDYAPDLTETLLLETITNTFIKYIVEKAIEHLHGLLVSTNDIIQTIKDTDDLYFTYQIISDNVADEQ